MNDTRKLVIFVRWSRPRDQRDALDQLLQDPLQPCWEIFHVTTIDLKDQAIEDIGFQEQSAFCFEVDATLSPELEVRAQEAEERCKG